MTFCAILAACCGPAFAGQLKLPAQPNGPVSPYPGTTNYYEPIANGSDSRQALIFKPTGSLNGAAVILLHASGQNQSQMANLTRAGRMAAHGTLVVFPQAIDSRGGEWNDNAAIDSGTNDVGYLAALAGAIEKEYHVDPKRISMAGYSNGGFMTARMVCERPELLHAAVLVAANMWQGQRGRCVNRPENLKVILIQGTADWVVPYQGKPRIGLPSASDSFTWFRAHRRNGCTSQASAGEPVTGGGVDDGTSISQQSDGCGTVLYTVTGGGHTWPGGVEAKGMMMRMLGKTSAKLDATSVLDSAATQ